MNSEITLKWVIGEKADETGKIRRHDQKRKNENRMGAGKHRKMHERD